MPIIEVKNLTHTYCPGTPYERKALDNISLSINKGEFWGVVGANSSGKSTLVQHFNGLLYPSGGKVTVCGKDVSIKQNRTELWKKVGLVFQYPEHQLFEATVIEDVSYGPKNQGFSLQESRDRAADALKKVGLEPQSISDLPPICLSGGLRRRVAIAGVLAMRPEILVLDEPTAGLDSPGRDMILTIIKKLQLEDQITVIMVSHSMKEIISLADHIAVLERGKLAACGTTKEVLRQQDLRNLPGVTLPDYLQLVFLLAERGKKVSTSISSVAEAELEVAKLLGRMADERN